MVRLAFYKGPAPNIARRIAHALICWRTGGPYSHVELLDGEGNGWSSSFLDGGVRRKAIDFDSGHWDVVEMDADLARALRWFALHEGEPYGWPGLLTWILGVRVSDAGWHFCSKAVAEALGVDEPWRVSPMDLYWMEAA